MDNDGNRERENGMIQKISKSAVIFWQDHPKEGVGEPAILLTKFTDCLELQQGENAILVTNERVEEFIRAIRKTMKGER